MRVSEGQTRSRGVSDGMVPLVIHDAAVMVIYTRRTCIGLGEHDEYHLVVPVIHEYHVVVVIGSGRT
jgi:hypothetical protein